MFLVLLLFIYNHVAADTAIVAIFFPSLNDTDVVVSGVDHDGGTGVTFC